MPVEHDLIKKCPLFRDLTDAECELLAPLLTYDTFPKDYLIFKEREPGHAMYFIESGEVTFYTLDAAGNPKTFRTLNAGAFFGEISLLTDQTRSAYARADTEVFALRLPGEHLDAFLRAVPRIASSMMREMAVRLRTSGELLQHTLTPGIATEIEMSRTDAEKRVQSLVRGVGAIPFIIINALVFVGWILWNCVPKLRVDAPPFGYLALFVSTEALFVALLILAKQNRDEKDSDIRTDRILQNTSATEAEIQHLRNTVAGFASALYRNPSPPVK